MLSVKVTSVVQRKKEELTIDAERDDLWTIFGN